MRPKDDDILIQLATRIPKALHREIKLHCVQHGTSVMDFVAAALEDKLKRGGGQSKRRATSR